MKKSHRSFKGGHRPAGRRERPESGTIEEVSPQLQAITSGRHLAWQVLKDEETSGRFIKDILSQLDQAHRLSSADRAAGVDISSGVIRQMRTLDVVLSSLLTRGKQNVEGDLWRVLLIGAWQLLYGRAPDHAVVDTSVELCRDLGRERWTGFVNGVLRNLARMLSEKKATGPAADALPLSDGTYRWLRSAVFADPQQSPGQYIAEAFSLPDVLVERWLSVWTIDEVLRAAFYFLLPPVVMLRVNPLRTTVDAVVGMLNEAGHVVTPGRLPNSLVIEGGFSPDRLPGFREGLWSIQDEAAMQAGFLLNPQPGEKILDLCAAPGGKTTHLAELSNDEAHITACDVAEYRRRRIRENVERLQLRSVEIYEGNAGKTDFPEGLFDAVLVDVPCSNTGVLSRRPEARWNFREHSMVELSQVQVSILKAACARTRPGGRIVYSTCSLEPEENRQVVDQVLSEVPGLKLVRDILHLPGSPADGAYQALLLKGESVLTEQQG